VAFPGHRNQLTTLKSGEDVIQKNEKVITVIYSEESLAKRKERNRQMGAIKQTESIYMLMHPSGCRVMKKARPLTLHINGQQQFTIVEVSLASCILAQVAP